MSGRACDYVLCVCVWACVFVLETGHVSETERVGVRLIHLF